jgi:hypothetical protein
MPMKPHFRYSNSYSGRFTGLTTNNDAIAHIPKCHECERGATRVPRVTATTLPAGQLFKLQHQLSKADINQVNKHEQKGIAPSDPHYPSDQPYRKPIHWPHNCDTLPASQSIKEEVPTRTTNHTRTTTKYHPTQNQHNTHAKMLSALAGMQPRQLAAQILNFALVLSTAFMLWKGLSVATDSSSPIVVVLSGSMEPAFQRGDLLFLWNRGAETQVGEVVVYNVRGKDIPIVHRVIRRFGGG